MEDLKLNKLTNEVIGIAIAVHKELVPGFDEKIYSNVLDEEFSRREVKYEKEKVIDFLVEGWLIIFNFCVLAVLSL